MKFKKTDRIKGEVSARILAVARRGKPFTNSAIPNGFYHRRQFATLVKKGKIVRLKRGAGAGSRSVYELPKWAAGQVWKTQHGQLFRVLAVREDGLATLQMIKPIRSRPMTQKPVPENWTLYDRN